MTDWIATIIVAVIAIIPGVYALIRQRSKDEATVRKSEADMIQIVQDIYQDMLRDVTEQSTKCKEQIKDMYLKIDEIVIKNRELIESNEELIRKIDELKEGVSLLVKQLIELGYDPVFNIKEE